VLPSRPCDFAERWHAFAPLGTDWREIVSVPLFVEPYPVLSCG